MARTSTRSTPPADPSDAPDDPTDISEPTGAAVPFGSPAATAALRAAGRRRLWEAIRHIRLKVAVLAALTATRVGATLLVPVMLASAIDAVRADAGVGAAAARLAVVLAVATLADTLEDVLGSYCGGDITAWLRHRLVGRVLALGVQGPRRFPTGDVLARLTESASAPAAFPVLLLSAAAALLTAVGAVTALALIDWWLAVVFALGVPPVVVALRVFVVKATEPFARYQRCQAAIVTRLLDARQGIRTIRASGTADTEVQRILGPLPELRAAGRETWQVQGRVSRRLAMLAPLVQVLVIGVAGLRLASGDITTGQLVASASYVAMAVASASLFDTVVALLNCQVGAGRVDEILTTSPAVRPPERPVRLPDGPGRLVLRGVTVRAGGRAVLDGLDLDVPPGATVAVAGASGSGKSVLVSTIGRLIDPDEGAVELDGVPVAAVPLPELRRAVAYAFERPALLGATVHDTIAYARPDATRAEVRRAADIAAADAFVRALPDGYDTLLTDAPMSGGELQRLGLARAALTDARVVVLDDATSSLDTATEAKVTRALRRILTGRTSLVVARRPATAARADLVAWLDGGRVRALAPHAELWHDPDYRAVFGSDPAAS
ncbi:ATP-binding cassette subfamily B protein [Actinomadura pelletieri DSM 43383]|uniref:ATP-binding cassette subfamily B protein n=1 Tax=Actinomadura pelletieri DSM 43383 TaxID=1120940 RepID=A0A495QAY2_9ACTN|nr:ABC transporter ATP-binding protein [Actinomadura pelletieri]RKS68849.1 ATP-binding cassette subfamily B protein [Actinomadura pelletieri DSM 43383]